MILKNFYKWIATTMTNKSTSMINTAGTATTGVGSGSWSNGIANISPFTLYGSGSIANTYASSMRNVRTSLTSYGGVVFGTGNTQPTLDDYTLSGSIVTTISAAVASVTYENTDDGVSVTGVYTITNTDASEITIREVGLLLNGQSGGFLMERTVLDSPVTIPAGGVGQVTYTIRMNYPT